MPLAAEVEFLNQFENVKDSGLTKSACKTVTGSSLCSSLIAFKSKKVQPYESSKPEQVLTALGM